MRVYLRPQAGGASEPPQTPGSCMAVHPGAATVEQDRALVPVVGCPVDGPADRGWQRDLDTLVPLPHTRRTRWPCSSPRSAMLTLVASKIRKPSRTRSRSRLGVESATMGAHAR
jgi:hypothetical protein